MKAITREEKIISGENLTPITRKEMFLAKASGQNIETPTPITREEYFLSKITGGGSSVEGTAIPVGVPVDRIYFNTALSVEETKAYLSQLTYVDVGFPNPIYPIFVDTNNDIYPNGMFILAQKVGNEYVIDAAYNIEFNNVDLIFASSVELSWRAGYNNGFISIDPSNDYDARLNCNSMEIGCTGLTDFNGIPVGAENEKIKNVLSITPFGASGGISNEPAAYTVSSVEELPSDAVDGSTAIVESDSNNVIGKWLFKNTPSIEETDGYVWLDSEVYCYTHNGFLGGKFIIYNDGDCTALLVGNETVGMIQMYNTDDDGWLNDISKEITVITCNDDRLLPILQANATRISKSLYTRENGEWVYKCEVV